MRKRLSRHEELERDTVNPRRNNMFHSTSVKSLGELQLGFDAQYVGRSLILRADCFQWLKRVPENSIHPLQGI
jgi:hypothetical protein